VTRGLVAGAYAILAAAHVWTRLYGLNRSYWHDEIVTVADFVRAGPREILAGPYIPNNHELFSLLAWMTSSVAGESEVAMRLFSVLPFLAGVALVTSWVHVRVSPLSGVFFLFLATVSPLLLDLSRLARGYGLAFFAMSLLVVAALEAARSERTWTIVAACAAGIVGTWTLPIFGVAFLATTATLLSEVSLRRRVAVGLGASVLAIATWYAPHIDDLDRRSRQDYGTHFGDRWLATAPIDQILIPALAWTEGVAATPGPIWIPVVLAALLLMGSSPFLRDRASALALVSAPIATIVTLWVTDTRSAPRFVSFLLIPLFMLGATGTASILERLTTRPAILRTLVALASLVALTAVAVPKVAEITKFARGTQEAMFDPGQGRGLDARVRIYLRPRTSPSPGEDSRSSDATRDRVDRLQSPRADRARGGRSFAVSRFPASLSRRGAFGSAVRAATRLTSGSSSGKPVPSSLPGARAASELELLDSTCSPKPSGRRTSAGTSVFLRPVEHPRSSPPLTRRRVERRSTPPRRVSTRARRRPHPPRHLDRPRLRRRFASPRLASCRPRPRSTRTRARRTLRVSRQQGRLPVAERRDP
jgi:hypothetical protein